MKEVFSTERNLIFLFFFFFLSVIFSQSVAAQNINPKKNYFAESYTTAPKIKIKSRGKIEVKNEKIIGTESSKNLFRAPAAERKIDFPEIENGTTIEENSFEKNFVEKTDFAYRFPPLKTRKRLSEVEKPTIEKKSFAAFSQKIEDTKIVFEDETIVEPNGATDDDAAQKNGFQWKPAIEQSLLFLAVQHGYAITAQAKTRRDLKHGAFWRDYARSVKSLHGWDDGGRFFTNYIAHPMQGALTGFIYVQNNPSEKKLQFNESSAYWKSRLKAFAWSAAWSTQFELGPISQASIGNVGLHGKETWGDIVVTPTIGTAVLISEDAIDRYITRRIERGTNSFYVKIFARMLLSPSRNFSNLLRFKQPWYRDRAEE